MKSGFEWDDKKAKANLKKHKVSFEDATAIFNDPLMITYPDVQHSDEEDRYIGIGATDKGTILVVVHVDKEKVIRLISCRKAAASERRRYEESKDE